MFPVVLAHNWRMGGARGLHGEAVILDTVLGLMIMPSWPSRTVLLS